MQDRGNKSSNFRDLKFIISVLSSSQPSASQGAENRIQLAASRELQECPHGVPLEFPGPYSHTLYPPCSAQQQPRERHRRLVRWATDLELQGKEGLGQSAPQLGKCYVALQELSSSETRVPEGQTCREEGLWTQTRFLGHQTKSAGSRMDQETTVKTQN